MHSWLASADQEKQVSASERHVSNGKFAALSFDLPWLTVAQEARRAPATSKEIAVNTGRLVDNDVHSEEVGPPYSHAKSR